jgi:FKBP-type peptidyl-prolyl cis-trans isomerase SlyD
MQIGPNTVVTMDYALRLDSGEVVDSSEGGEPLVFHFGQGQIVPGLERELAGLQNGDQKEVRVAPEEAYGARQPGAVLHQLPLDRFPEDITPEIGMRLSVRGPQGEDVPLTITAVSDGHATLDFNHPLAGEVLTFSVTVRDVQSDGGGRIILPGEA